MAKALMRSYENVNSLIHWFFYNMRCFYMFATAVCILFLLKLKWPKNKSFYALTSFVKCMYSMYRSSLIQFNGRVNLIMGQYSNRTDLFVAPS